MSEVDIRTATQNDHDAIWAILKPVFRAGDSYAVDRDISKKNGLAYWCDPSKQTFVAEMDGQILGTYYLRANQAGGGAHVCNCGYVTSGAARGQGVAGKMCLHSIDAARESGFRAMQYNCVVSTNKGAIRLWEKLGFDIVGTLPKAFRHPEHGEVDALVMYQIL